MSVRALTLLGVLALLANECRPANARVSVPHRSVKQPVRLDLNLNEGRSEESIDIIAEAFKR